MADLLNKTQVFPVSQKGVTLVELMVGIAIGLLVISVAVGAGLSLLGVVYPAAVAARMRPIEAMRAQE